MKPKEEYNHSKVESKWQKKWAKTDIYKTPDKATKKKYILDMFPYPSGATMHVGHLEGYVGTDVYSRYLRMSGFSVLHPMGWDAFGLPAENYAIKTGINPNESTHKNIETFKRQLINVGLSYDWSREIDTSDPKYYKWTQWLFIQLFNKGLAYKAKAPVNWCPKDETVLANEQVIDGKCERCDTEVVQKELDQWFFKITAYADRLISGLDKINWAEDVKVQQKNWIGRSEGMNLKLGDIEVFTTRPDTLNGATFIAIANGHATKTGEKEGKFTGKYIINPITKQKMPVWAVNYVDKNYGTGAVMGVPYLDERDAEFAKKYKLEVLEIKPDKTISEKAEKEGWGKKVINYHIRDWLISRQRYWGCPIPMIYCEDCGWQPVPDSDLPVLLPNDVDFLPHGESPIARSETFQQDVKCPKCGKKAKRETDTMDGFGDNSWYFIRFVDPKNEARFASNEAIKAWLPVDTYVGGGHVVQHLLYSRFFWKVLFDEGLIDKSVGDEPFIELRAPGWILGPDSRKMSKRWGNVITPDDIIPKFGADVLRLYEMFMGPFDVVKPFNLNGVEGMHRFTKRVWSLYLENKESTNEKELLNIMHQTIQKVTKDIEIFHYNTAISSIMEFVNFLKDKGTTKEALTVLCQLIAPFAPHIAEEIWVEILGNSYSVHNSTWPKSDSKYLKVDKTTIIIQINGKMRSSILVDIDQSKDEVVSIALKDEKVHKWINGKIYKVIYVPGKIINFVVSL
jgi:leucyl-tRNA synthetase